ncbi:MAG: glycerophosphodiester phosphodiesterase family protein [Gammaproteobacteria bacterium]
MKFFPGTGLVAGIVSLLITVAAPAETEQEKCLVIAHRGASGYVPEHTLAAYRLAILLGADYIEPDLVMTRDGHFIARHENRLSGTTDISDHAAFSQRRATRTINDRETSDWFSEDFTLPELRQLRARERLPEVRPANTSLNDLFPIPSLQDIIDMVRDMEQILGRSIGLYPELKSPAYFRDRGLDPEGTLVEVLEANDYRGTGAPVFIQSFETDSLKRLNDLTEIRLVYLLARDADTPAKTEAQISNDGLRQLAEFVDGIGVEKYGLLIPRDEAGNLSGKNATDLPQRAHSLGLVVHAWTFRAENEFLPANLRSAGPNTALGDSLAEHRLFIDAGIDGFFTEQPDIARAACNETRQRRDSN